MIQSKRLESFDLLRFFFVLLALAAHFRISQGVGYELKNLNPVQTAGAIDLPYHIALTRSSMSALLIIFGFMIEYVYAGIWKTKGALVVLEKMLTRTLICYLAFVAVASLAIVAVGGGTFKILLGTISFAYVEHGFAFLFKYYTFLIPIVFLLMWVRFKYGWSREMLAVGGLLLLAEGMKAVTNGFPGAFEALGQSLFGLGNKMGPSVIHSLVLIIFGGLAANYIKTRKTDAKAWLLVSLVLLSVASLGYEIYSLGFGQFVIQMSSTATYRAHNSYVYFAFGIVSFLSFWLVSWVIIRQLGTMVKELISYYGGNTFIIFLYGNLFMLFVPRFDAGEIGYYLALATCLGLSLVCVNAYYWASKNLTIVVVYNQLIRLLVSLFLCLFFGIDRFEDNNVKLASSKKKVNISPMASLKKREAEDLVEL